ncbi:MAG: Phosphomannomutase [Chloroflexi bacterium]|jgi:alpha-D-glucose phosphate-specific phosphoglucomutase|nr:MAG: Phosphomannomutase [Chloroflexota bacterium]
MPIRFGTDGWRAIIAEDYTFDNVRACAQGVADYLKEQGLAERGVVVGYDTRFASEDFAAAAAEVLAANGVKTYLGSAPSPTPTTSWSVIHRKAGGGIVITASHNPPQWNGFKYKPDYGGSAAPEVVEALEGHIDHALATDGVRRIGLAEARQQGTVELVDLAEPYMAQISSLLDLEAIKNSGLKIVVDTMYGAGTSYIASLLAGGSATITEINSERNPAFPGIAQPEPIAHNLQKLAQAVIGNKADVGIALDGDADRLGIIDEHGRFMSPLQVFSLLALYLLETRGQKGALVKSLTMSSMIWRLGEQFAAPVFETAVGFKYVGAIMRRENALAGGEESGGFGFRGHLPERDGVLSGLYFLDMMVRMKRSPSELLDYLYEKVGPHHYRRWDIQFNPARMDEIRERVEQAKPDSLASRSVTAIDVVDGFRFHLEGGAWGAVRFSGTEPLVRIYAEAESVAAAEAILEAIRNLAKV